MPGRTTGDNKFGITPHIVGTILGDGCNYTLIQDAINDIQAAGGIGTIYLRPGTYTEDLSFISSGSPLHIDVVGAATDGRLPAPLGSVNLFGSHTVGGDNLTVAFLQDIAMEATVGDAWTINPTAGQSIVALQECSVNNTVGRCAVLNASGGAVAQFSTQDSQINTQLVCVENLSDTAIVTAIRGTFASAAASAFVLGATCSAMIDGAQVSGADNGFEVSPTSNILVTNAIINSTNACYAMPLIGGSAQVYGCIHTSADPSGYFITGDSALTYCNITQTGSAIGIDPLMSTVVNDWKPYAIEAPGPAPAAGYSRGTALFNEDHFDVSDGFVSMASTMPYYSLTPYIVGPDVHSEFSTIGAAITQAVADGASSVNPKIIHVKPTPIGYTENLTIPDGINVLALQPTATSVGIAVLEPMPVRLIGNVTFSSGLGRITGFSIDPGVSNAFIVDDSVGAVVNNCAIDHGAAAYLMEFTGTGGTILFEGISADGNANFITDQAGFFNIYLEDSTLFAFGATSVLADNSSVIVRMRYSRWHGAITGGTGTLGAFDARYSEVSDALGGALIIAETASLGGFHSLFEAGSTFLLDSTNIGNVEMRHCSLSPYAFSAPQANIAQIVLDQCTVLAVPTAGSTEIFRPTPGNIWRGTYSERFIVNIQTTDATPTTLLAIPLLDPETVAVFGEVIAFDATFNGALSGPVNGSARRNGGAAVFVADQSSPAQEGTLGAASFQCAVSGNDLIVQVTGLVGVTINWSADFKVLHLQTDT